MIRENIGIVMELKHNETARDGLEPIFQNNHTRAFHNNEYNPIAL